MFFFMVLAPGLGFVDARLKPLMSDNEFNPGRNITFHELRMYVSYVEMNSGIEDSVLPNNTSQDTDARLTYIVDTSDCQDG